MVPNDGIVGISAIAGPAFVHAVQLLITNAYEVELLSFLLNNCISRRQT
jgi:hypothetical protein